jgi:hypothetical protein
LATLESGSAIYNMVVYASADLKLSFDLPAREAEHSIRSHVESST